jgi:putative membrane protein
MMDGGGWWMMGGGFLVLLALIVVVVFLVVRQPGAPQDRGAQRSAAAILADRFARGEIDEQEYRSRLDELRR